MDPRNEATAALLVELGLPRPQARVVAFLARSGESASPDLERAVDLRQPEMSLAVQRLRARGLVAWRAVPSGGRGRPTHHYRLARSWAETCDALAGEGAEGGLVARLRASLPE